MGEFPALTPEGQRKAEVQAAERRRWTAIDVHRRGPADGPEDRSVAERCILGFNSGPPMIPSACNNNVRVVQAPGYVVLLNEMVHNARIVPLDGRPHVPGNVRLWVGDSRGRWDGTTLVVETKNFSSKTRFTARAADPLGGLSQLRTCISSSASAVSMPTLYSTSSHSTM